MCAVYYPCTVCNQDHNYLDVSDCPGDKYNPPFSLKYRRGYADGKWGHPPAEVTEDYLTGYNVGLNVR